MNTWTLWENFLKKTHLQYLENYMYPKYQEIASKTSVKVFNA